MLDKGQSTKFREDKFSRMSPRQPSEFGIQIENISSGLSWEGQEHVRRKECRDDVANEIYSATEAIHLLGL